MRGKMNAIILNTLKDSNKYGLEIIKSIKSLTNNQVDIKLPSLYNNLHKLEAEGYINSYWENSEIGGKRRYSALTDKGRKYVLDHPYDFDEFKNINTIKNSSSTLAIQPDFFNTIEHAQKNIDEQLDTSPSHTKTTSDIDNYSILDYIRETTKIQNDNNNSYEEIKDDAVLLKDNEIIPQSSATSLLYKQTTLTNDDLNKEAVDYKDIFGEMLVKDCQDNDLDEKIKTGFEDTNQGILLSPNEKGKFTNDYLSMVSNKSTTNVENTNTLLFSKDKNTEKIEEKNNISKKIDDYLLKEKVKVDDNLKANIFLKKQNNVNVSYSYSLKPKTSVSYFDNVQEIKTQNKLNNSNTITTNDNFDVSNISLNEFINNCENNGIKVQKYRKNNNKLRSHKIYINKTNFLTSFVSYISLVIFLLIGYFSFDNGTREMLPIFWTMLSLMIVALLYPTISLIICLTNKNKLIGFYNLRKELLPRSIISIVIILITFAINFFCGLNSVNFMEFLPFIIMPIICAIIVFLDYFYKALFLQLKIYREK